jgi:hypothetical protein
MGQLATELTISADEFDNYDIFATSISLAFHLREFNVCPPPVSQPSQCLHVHELVYGMVLIRQQLHMPSQWRPYSTYALLIQLRLCM